VRLVLIYKNMKKCNLSSLLDIKSGSVVAVTGCGGKTSIIDLLAKQNKDKKVLVTPATKIFPPRIVDTFVCDTIKSCIQHEPATGVQYFGILNIKNGKLEALPEDIVFKLIPRYDIVLMEADGSRGLPCKGWLDDEPVVYSWSTHTVGVITMSAADKSATGDIVHNLHEFLSLTGLRQGEKITQQALEDMVCLPEGMFRKTAGVEYLIINRVENEVTIHLAENFLKNINGKYPGRFKRMIFGSAYMDVWYEG